MKKRWIALALGIAAAAGTGLYQGQRSPALAPPLTIDSGVGAERLALSPDGRLLAEESVQEQVLLYDAVTGEQKCAFGVRTAHTGRMIFSQNGRRLLTENTRPSPANPTGAVQVWDTATGAQISRFVPPGQATAMGPDIVTFSPDLRWAVVHGGQRCTVYDIATGGVVRVLPLRPLNSYLNSQGAFSPNAGLLAVSGAAGGLQIWDTKTWQPIHATVGRAFRGAGIHFSLDGTRLALGSKAGLAWWDTRTWRQEGRFPLRSSRGLSRGSHDSYYFSSDSRSLMVNQGDPANVLHQVDCVTGRETLTVPDQELQHISLTGNRGQTWVVPRSYQSLLYRDTYCIWNTARSQVQYQITLPTVSNFYVLGRFQIHSTAFSADGHVFAAGGFDDGIIRVWRLP